MTPGEPTCHHGDICNTMVTCDIATQAGTRITVGNSEEDCLVREDREIGVETRIHLEI